MNDAIMVSPRVCDMGGRSEEVSGRDDRGAVRNRRLFGSGGGGVLDGAQRGHSASEPGAAGAAGHLGGAPEGGWRRAATPEASKCGFSDVVQMWFRSVAFQMWFRWRCDSDGSLRRAHRERTEILEWSSWLPRYRRRAERIARRHPPGAQSVRLGIRAGSVGRRALRPGQSTGSGAVMRGRSRRSAKFCRAVRIRVHG